MCSPLISVIIPAYNAEATICDALNSVFNQSFVDYEVIVVDDCSSDSTAMILTQYLNHKNYCFVSQSSNRGVSAARNRGLALAKGVWTCFLDADDLLAPDYLRSFEPVLNKDVDLILSGIAYQSEGKLTFKRNASKESLSRDALGKLAVHIIDNKLCDFSGCNPEILGFPFGKLYKTQLAVQIGFNEDIGMREDALFNLCYFAKAQSAISLTDSSYIYRLTPGSASLRFRSNYQTEVKRFILACSDVWDAEGFEKKSLDVGILYAYMSWLKLFALHKDRDFPISDSLRLINDSFTDPIWANAFSSVSSSDVPKVYSILAKFFESNNAVGICVLKFANDFKKAVIK